MNPVSVVRAGTPAAAAIRSSKVDDTTERATTRSSPVVCREHVRTEQPADLVAGEHLPPAAVRHRDREAVGVGIVGDDEVGVVAAREVEREVEHAGLLRVRERRGGEVGIGLRLLVDDDRRREPGPLPQREEHVEADAVQRRVDDAQVARGPGPATAAATSRYASSASSPIGVIRSEFGSHGISLAGPADAMCGAISASVGGMICEPVSS